jgi:hypothetical protein
MAKLREKQVEVLGVLTKKMSPADVAEELDSYPGPMARCMWALVELGLVKEFGNEEKGFTFKRTAAGSKAYKAA